MERPDLETIAALLTRDLRVAGDRYSVDITSPPRSVSLLLTPSNPEAGIALNVDGVISMWMVFWQTDDWAEELAGAVEQVQTEVMEHEAELWPECPLHRHELVPTPRDGRVVWECMETERVFAELGALPESFAV